MFWCAGSHQRAILTISHTIAGMTARCRCTFRYGNVRFLCHSTHFLLVFVSRLQWIICQPDRPC